MKSFDHRSIFLKMSYVQGLSGLLSACIIFLEKARREWNEKIERYGTHFISVLEAWKDESWRFNKGEREIVRQAYNTLRRALEVIRKIVKNRGVIDENEVIEVQNKIEEVLRRLGYWGVE